MGVAPTAEPPEPEPTAAQPSVAEPTTDPQIEPTSGKSGQRPIRVALLVAIPVGLVLTLLIVVLGTRKAALDRTVASPLLGQQAPAVAGKTIGGARFDLGRESGWVLVNFFASWCTPCRVEHPELRAFEQEHAAKGDVSLVSVVYGDETSDVRRFFAKNGGGWPVVLDPDGRIALDYFVARVPETYLVAPDGTVVYKVASGVTRVGLDRLIRQANKATR